MQCFNHYDELVRFEKLNGTKMFDIIEFNELDALVRQVGRRRAHRKCQYLSGDDQIQTVATKFNFDEFSS